MIARAFGIGVLVGVAATVAAAPSTHGYWLQPVPVDPGEAALRDALARSAFDGPAATAEALLRVSMAHPATAVSGLAQLGAGWLLLEAGRPAEAVPLLRHADAARTALVDHLRMTLAESLEAAGDVGGAATAYIAAAEALPQGPVACPALLRGAEALVRAGSPDKAVDALNRAFAGCPGQEPRALLRIAEIQAARKNLRAAAEAYDRLDRDYPASAQSREGAQRLRSLAGMLPPEAPKARTARDLRKALALFDAGRYPEAAALLRSLQDRKLATDEANLVRVRLGRALLFLHRRGAEAALGAVAAGSPYEAEAAFQLARLRARRQPNLDALEAVAARFPGTVWGEEALLALANHYQKDARDDDAVPYYRRLLEAYPDGRYSDRATWRVAWADYRQGRFEEAAQALERAARLRPLTSYTPGFLYWAGRARRDLGQNDRARQLLDEAVQRFKHTYHGMRAREALAGLPAPPATPQAVLRGAASDPQAEIPEPQLTRIRQLLLLDRLDAALEDLKSIPATRPTQATIAWIESRKGHLRPAITAMKRAYPEYVGEAGDSLPEEVWRILYPLEFAELLKSKAAGEGLDAALVAALICQESTFDAGAVSRAGARGLMQVIPHTGRALARSLGVRYERRALHKPEVSLDFGMRYLRLMLDRFGGRIERALAAYNAGPHRVEAWTASRPEISAEEFIESIPFTETRGYVMTILADQEQYRRIYSIAAQAPSGAGGGARR